MDKHKHLHIPIINNLPNETKAIALPLITLYPITLFYLKNLTHNDNIISFTVYFCQRQYTHDHLAACSLDAYKSVSHLHITHLTCGINL